MKYFQANKSWLLPLLLVGIFAPFTTDIDLHLARQFYTNGHFVSNELTTFLFNYGPLPAWIAFSVAVIIFIFSYFVRRISAWRAPALTMVLTMCIGSGVIVHAILKDHWGRPRPKQVVEFGGTQQFRPFYMVNFSNPEKAKSFPSGHAAMGFYFFALAIAGRQLQSKPLFYLGMGLAICLGLALSFLRIAQGGHFFSDTVFAALIMWLTSLVITTIVQGDMYGT